MEFETFANLVPQNTKNLQSSVGWLLGCFQQKWPGTPSWVRGACPSGHTAKPNLTNRGGAVPVGHACTVTKANTHPANHPRKQQGASRRPAGPPGSSGNSVWLHFTVEGQHVPHVQPKCPPVCHTNHHQIAQDAPLMTPMKLMEPALKRRC